MPHRLAREGRLYERAAYLVVAPVHIIRPLQTDAGDIAAESLAQCEGVGHGEHELVRCVHAMRTDEYGEEQVGAVLTLPVIGALSAPVGLIFGSHHHYVVVAAVAVVAQKVVCGVYLLESDDVCIHV